ncbi:LemA family protein [Acetivibrio sp. MSJd-27]|jgi:putative lemA family protein|uniref:LemA family protein n=1 Tax=Acetivibrio sp. MSJd-27 TaxID=2841523 RepID=UPI0015B1DDF3|nr:LemA family protein [Acetivibrio sp. MSJd-27]MBU5450905.1 LemA family protein [Acetivibrio sp. MSJd-27]
MKKFIPLIVILAVIVILGGSFIGMYNGLVSMDTEVQNAYSNIESQMQRRGDLIPNLVSTVKGYAAHEEEVLTSIADARAKLAGAGSVQELENADNQLSSALSRLLVVVEKYPDLKANENFQALMDELSGTENRIAVARKDYNDTVKEYNKAIKQFPKNFVASIFGFESAEFFRADEGAKEVPKVDFGK